MKPFFYGFTLLAISLFVGCQPANRLRQTQASSLPVISDQTHFFVNRYLSYQASDTFTQASFAVLNLPVSVSESAVTSVLIKGKRFIAARAVALKGANPENFPLNTRFQIQASVAGASSEPITLVTGNGLNSTTSFSVL